MDNVETIEETVMADISAYNFEIKDNESYMDANYRLVEELERGILSLRYEQLPKQCELNQFVEDITELFFEKYDRFPTPYSLNKLANVCTLYFIKNKSTTKQKEANAFQTERQLKSRRKRERAGFEESTLDYLQNRRMSPDNYSKVQTKTVEI